MASSHNCILGLDIGSSCMKASVFDLSGSELARSSRNVEGQAAGDGRFERDPEAVWLAAKIVIQEAAQAVGGRIAGIGVTGCGNGAVFLDAAGTPFLPGILSSDRRAIRQMETSQPAPNGTPYPGQLPYLIKWLREESPCDAKKLAHALFWKDFIRFRLTGFLHTDPTDAGAAGLLNKHGVYRQSEACLPELISSQAISGSLRCDLSKELGLPLNIAVATGCIDCEAAAIGCGINAPGTLSVVAGTWSINQAYSNHPDPQLFLCNPSVSSHQWLWLEGGPDSVSAFNWFQKSLLQQEGHQALIAAASPWLGRADKPVFIPRLSTGQGLLVGLASHHQQPAITASVMEGLVFQHAFYVNRLRARGLHFHNACLSGAITREPVWRQLFADALELSVHLPHVDEPGTLGAAICAAVALGEYPTIEAAQAGMVRISDAVRPAHDMKALREQFFEIGKTFYHEPNTHN